MLPITRVLLIDTELRKSDEFFYKTYPFASFNECVDWLKDKISLGEYPSWSYINHRFVVLLPELRSGTYFRLDNIRASGKLIGIL